MEKLKRLPMNLVYRTSVVITQFENEFKIIKNRFGNRFDTNNILFLVDKVSWIILELEPNTAMSNFQHDNLVSEMNKILDSGREVGILIKECPNRE